jgi:CPA1 family monovalent cation:H+ antiporter
VPPDPVLALVLPPIVYAAAFFTPIRSFKQDIGNIASLAVGLVLASAFAVAGVTMVLVPGITVAIAVTLGAIVSPPDEVAATAVMERLAVPRRVIALLDGESLLNDATALTVFRVALAAAIAETTAVTWAPLGGFFVVAIGGIALGLAVGWLMFQIRSRLDEVPVAITASFVTPYAAYVPAELLGVSGILAAVTAGLFLGRRQSRFMGSDVRVAGRAVWEMLIFLLNGLVFILIGLEISALIRAMDRDQLAALAAIGLVVSLVLVLVRAIWIFAMAAWQRYVAHAEVLRLGEIVVLSWSGMRGSVSLAAALALPTSIATGSPLPARAAVLVITFTVILVTLVGQGLTLPMVIRAVRLGRDEDVVGEEREARAKLVDEALGRLDELYEKWPGHRPLIEQLRAAYRHRAEHHEQVADGRASEAEQELIEHRQIRRDVIDAQREALLDMRDRGAIDDDVLRNIERDLDLEELRMEA